MEYLQYDDNENLKYHYETLSFKPCYKWNTFNTVMTKTKRKTTEVLNLVINGIPSIQSKGTPVALDTISFKPCYKWNTFNTLDLYKDIDFVVS